MRGHSHGAASNRKAEPLLETRYLRSPKASLLEIKVSFLSPRSNQRLALGLVSLNQ